MKRTVIKINEKLCNGCGKCVKGCHEGALQMINGKAVLVSELYCDGLGACIGDCPVGAIELEEREAEPYNEDLVMERIIKKGDKAISAHLDHLKNNGEKLLYQQGIQYLKDNKIDMTNLNKPKVCNHKLENIERNSDESSLSELTNFPVQMHLISPESSIFNKSDVIFAADCTAYAYKRFHSELIKNKKLIIACPKLDSRKESYIDKLSILIDNAKINTLSVVIMQVPCCNGLIKIATDAREKAERYIPIKKIVISVKGEILTDEWI